MAEWWDLSPAQRRGHSLSIPHVMVGGEERKSCARCAKLLPLAEFTKDSGRKDGLEPYCRGCVKGRRAK